LNFEVDGKSAYFEEAEHPELRINQVSDTGLFMATIGMIMLEISG